MPETSTPANRRRLWPRLRRIWAMTGTMVLLGLTGWSLLAFRASDAARHALVSDDHVQIARHHAHWLFSPLPAARRHRAGLLFFPGALVEAAAYAPLARTAADAGFTALLAELPRRGAFGGADHPGVLEQARAAMAAVPAVPIWVVAGHSRGGVVAARLAREGGPTLGGLVLIGTSHPRDFSLADLAVPVVKVLGTRDCVADIAKSEANRHLLPPTSRWVTIDGGNHSQFGWYGFQPGDCWATIDRGRQHAQTVEAVLHVLADAAQRTSVDRPE